MYTIAHMWTLSFCCVASGIKFRASGLEAGSLSHLAGLPSAFASLKLVLVILEKKIISILYVSQPYDMCSLLLISFSLYYVCEINPCLFVITAV